MTNTVVIRATKTNPATIPMLVSSGRSVSGNRKAECSCFTDPAARRSVRHTDAGACQPSPTGPTVRRPDAAVARGWIFNLQSIVPRHPGLHHTEGVRRTYAAT